MNAASRHAAAFLHVWAVPLGLAAMTVFGLLAALLGTGWWHGTAWLALSMPVVVAVRCSVKRHAG
ncbi:MAG TPA: hypothetical protein VMH77_05135 [Steroidobacteraceae bacterium]|nr:hypothetical protein [Steroidobacteraceae bacterium]